MDYFAGDFLTPTLLGGPVDADEGAARLALGGQGDFLALLIDVDAQLFDVDQLRFARCPARLKRFPLHGDRLDLI